MSNTTGDLPRAETPPPLSVEPNIARRHLPFFQCSDLWRRLDDALRFAPAPPLCLDQGAVEQSSSCGDGKSSARAILELCNHFRAVGRALSDYRLGQRLPTSAARPTEERLALDILRLVWQMGEADAVFRPYQTPSGVYAFKQESETWAAMDAAAGVIAEGSGELYELLGNMTTMAADTANAVKAAMRRIINTIISEREAAPPLATLQGHEEESKDGGSPADGPKQARFGSWAFGTDNGLTWHIFRRRKARWAHWGKLCTLHKGRAQRLMSALAEGGGLLSMRDAVHNERKVQPGSDDARLKKMVTQELSRFRGHLRGAMGVKDTSKKNDPLPYDDKNHCWQALVAIGYAIVDEGRFIFRPRERLTADEQMDIDQG
jgi:hypothetical protein